MADGEVVGGGNVTDDDDGTLRIYTVKPLEVAATSEVEGAICDEDDLVDLEEREVFARNASEAGEVAGKLWGAETAPLDFEIDVEVRRSDGKPMWVVDLSGKRKSVYRANFRVGVEWTRNVSVWRRV